MPTSPKNKVDRKQMSDPIHPVDQTTPSLDTRLVRELADLLNDTGLGEIEVEHGALRIRVAKAASSAGPPTSAAYSAAPTPAVAPTAGAPAVPMVAPVAGETVKSPMVGTVYLQAQPGAPPFARAGDRVNEGQTLMLVEAMKTMNPISAPKAGILVEYLVVDGQPVEYGEPLVVID